MRAHHWAAGVERWRRRVGAITGTRVEVVEAALSQVRSRLASRSTLWRDIARGGGAVYALPVDQLRVEQRGGSPGRIEAVHPGSARLVGRGPCRT